MGKRFCFSLVVILLFCILHALCISWRLMRGRLRRAVFMLSGSNEVSYLCEHFCENEINWANAIEVGNGNHDY